MATFTSFYYDDEDQSLAKYLFRFKGSKIYAVERMGVEGISRGNDMDDIAEFYVQAEVEQRYRKNKKDQWQSLEEFWTMDRMFAHSCPHWQRRSVKVTVGLGLRYNDDPNPICNKMVTFTTWFDNKYKSQADGIANSIVDDSYDSTAQQVQADWNDKCITNDMVQENALLNGVGIMSLLSKHLQKEKDAHTKKILEIFSKVKI